MNEAYKFLLKVARHVYFRKWHVYPPRHKIQGLNGKPSDFLSNIIRSEKPCMIARFGDVELNLISKYYLHMHHSFSSIDYIKGKMPFDEWDETHWNDISTCAGFFPRGNKELIERFCELYYQDIPQLDVLASWVKYDSIFDDFHHAHKIYLLNLEPWNPPGEPWSQYLEGRKVLVIHPFVKTIEKQYKEKRELLFQDKRILPEFDLQTIKAVQGFGGIHPEGFETWFDALDYMKNEMDRRDYDVALIGCGAYGFPLAAHAKRMGKQAVHLGGALQLLFGIIGSRWLKDGYGDGIYDYRRLINEYWVFPDSEETPSGNYRYSYWK